MPDYCYLCPDCEKAVGVTKPMAKCKELENCPNCGVEMYRDFHLEQGGIEHTPGDWPMTSYAAGISAEEIPEFKKIDAAGGVPTEYSKDGDPVFTSKRHRRDYCKLHGMYDRNGGYGDPMPDNR